MAFFAEVPELLSGLTEGLDNAASVLSSGSDELMTRSSSGFPIPNNIPINTRQTIPTTEVLAPVTGDFPVTNIYPRNNINIPLMRKDMVPTWTSTRAYDPIIGNDRDQEVSSETGEVEPDSLQELAQRPGKNPLNANQQNFSDSFSKSFKALKAMSLGEITGLVSSAFQASPRGNVMGSAVTSGINWGHDAQITSQVQSGQEHMQRSQDEWQNQQNQNSYSNQQKMQATDIANRQTMQSREFGQQDSMQRRQFGQDTSMQQARFGQQTSMQQGQFGHENSMQQAGFGQQTSMSNLDYSHNLSLGKQGILGNLANTATGGAFSVINTAINAGVGYLEQGRDQTFQKQMQTSNFNNSIYASGNSATALKIATPVS